MNIELFDSFNQKGKLIVCRDLNSFVTYNGISKDTIIHIFKWLYSESVIESEERNAHNEDYL